jgi:hypothetical protein
MRTHWSCGGARWPNADTVACFPTLQNLWPARTQAPAQALRNPLLASGQSARRAVATVVRRQGQVARLALLLESSGDLAASLGASQLKELPCRGVAQEGRWGIRHFHCGAIIGDVGASAPSFTLRFEDAVVSHGPEESQEAS